MVSTRTICSWIGSCLLVAAAAGRVAAAQNGSKHTLAAQHRPGELVRVEIALQVGGDVKLVSDQGQPLKLPMSVVANLAYDEATLAVHASGRPERSVRYYDDARAVIKIDQGGEKPEFSAARRLIVASRRPQEACQLYCPREPLLREELDLIDVPGGSLVLDDALPERPVAAGDTWKLSDAALVALLGVDAVSYSDVECVLGEVTDGVADVAAAGMVSAAVGGVSTEIQLKIKYKFSLAARRMTHFALLIKENRGVGHLGPGLDTVAKVLVRLTPIRQSSTLTADIVRSLPPATTPDLLALAYRPAGGQFQLSHDRRWYVTGDDPKLTVLRMLDRGELLAQCNLSALPAVKKPVTLAEFQRDIERSLGKNFGKFTGASQTVNAADYAVFRVDVHGTVSQVPIDWIYYLVQDRQGRRVSLAFTLEEGQRQKFGQADLQVVSSLHLTDPPVPTAARPAANR